MPLDTTGKLIGAFVTLLIGIMFLTNVSSETLDKTALKGADNETVDITLARARLNNSILTNFSDVLLHAPAGWETDDSDCNVLQNVVYKTNNGTTLVLNTHYNLTTNKGRVALLNDSFWQISTQSNNTVITYLYCGQNYLSENWSRTVLNTAPGLFGLALLLVSVGLFWSIGKDYDFY